MESIKNEKFQKLEVKELSNTKGGFFEEITKILSITTNADGTTTKLVTVLDTETKTGYRDKIKD